MFTKEISSPSPDLNIDKNAGLPAADHFAQAGRDNQAHLKSLKLEGLSSEQLEAVEAEIGRAQIERAEDLDKSLTDKARQLYDKLIETAKQHPKKTSFALDWTLGVNVLKAAVEAATGRDIITKKKLKPTQRITYVLAGAGMVYALTLITESLISGKLPSAKEAAAAIVAKIVSGAAPFANLLLSSNEVARLANKAFSMAAENLAQSKELFLALAGQVSLYADRLPSFNTEILQLKLGEAIRSKNG